MKRNTKLITLFLLSSLVLCSCGKSQGLTKKQKLEDFEYMCKIVSDNHPALSASNVASNWDQLQNDYKDKVKKTDNDEDFRVLLSTMLQTLHDPNTLMVSDKNYAQSKTMFQDNEFWGKEFQNDKVMARYKSSEDLLTQGNTISQTSENILTDKVTPYKQNFNVDYVKISRFDVSNAENDMKKIKDFVANTESTKLLIDLRNTSQGSDLYWTKYLAPTLFKKDMKWSTYSLYRDGDYLSSFIDSIKEKKSIAQLDPKTVPSVPKDSLSGFDYFLESTSNIASKNPINFSGKIYILVSTSMSSSAVNFSKFVQQNKVGKLVGQLNPNPSMEGCLSAASLPNSGYIFIFSASLIKDSFDIKCFTPDILEKGIPTAKLSIDNCVNAAGVD